MVPRYVKISILMNTHAISLVSDFDFFLKFPSNFVSMKALNLIGKIKLWKLFM